ncbi:MAG: plasmid pRiA4b ORF-3 family protein, partial [Candidatus Kapabacteria bacterium]|nr:plasmid pRiA4b ORF-3 family protein [Candidatus Kapabacteria bacterium]
YVFIIPLPLTSISPRSCKVTACRDPNRAWRDGHQGQGADDNVLAGRGYHMITIHATKKLLAKLKVEPAKNPPVSTGQLGPWYADVKIINRQHIVIALNERSLICVHVPWTSFKADPARSIGTALRPVLEAIGLPSDVIEAEVYAIDTATFTTTSSRATLGRLNSAVGVSIDMINDGEALDVTSILLSQYLYSPSKGQRSSGYLFPYQVVGEILGQPTHPPMDSGSPPSIPLMSLPMERARVPIEKKPVLKKVVVLRIALDGIRPEIWRTIMVPDTITLRRLHDVIQAAMGWDEMHLHLFKIKGTEYGDLEMFEDFHSMKEERFVTLQSIKLATDDSFVYEYDMGDGWRHTITVLGTAEVEPDYTFRVIDGANAVPPEDVGGVHGYAQFVLAMMDPKHEEHEEYMQWYGRPFDHTMFDLRGAIRLLAVLEYTGAGYPWKRSR